MASEAEKSAVKPAAALDFERPLPHNLEAERSVLAAMLREPGECVDEVVEVLGEAAGGMFYSHQHREVFEAIIDLKRSNMGVDLLTVAQRLSERGTIEKIGGEVFLAELYGSIATTANLESWCEILRKFYVLRRMIAVCSESVMSCYDADRNPDEIIEKVEKSVFDVRFATEKSQVVDLKSGLTQEFQHILDIANGKEKIGIQTGYPKLDALTGGLKPGEMFVLAARPSIGKTSLALNIIRNVAAGPEKARVLFFSLEMSAAQIFRRLLCTEADVTEANIRDHKFQNTDVPKLTRAVSGLRSASIWVDPTPALSIGAVQARARRLKNSHGIDIVVIDYLTLMNSGGRAESRQNEVAEISRGIKQMAKDLDIPVLVLAQLNREFEKNADPNALPKLSHLRESGAIEQDADVVAFLHRDRTVSRDLTPEQERQGTPAKLIVEKNRNGQTGIMELTFYPSRMLFGVASRYHGDDVPPDATA
ncbi:MAG: replicative DNA helicase [Victivallaceae bacterium]|nr:replicative DNA helicase [Victivallaceae bacterium]